VINSSTKTKISIPNPFRFVVISIGAQNDDEHIYRNSLKSDMPIISNRILQINNHNLPCLRSKQETIKANTDKFRKTIQRRRSGRRTGINSNNNNNNLIVRAYKLSSVDQDELNAPKIDISLTRIRKKNKIGEGNFGSVFKGTMDGDDEGKARDVILKAITKKIGRDTESFYRDELKVLDRLKECAGVGKFIGVAGANVYLVFADQGERTLEMAMESGRAFDVVRKAFDVDESRMSDKDVLKLGAKTLLESCSLVNAEKIVHRDVKPANILICENKIGKSEARRFILIDLGAACDLKSSSKKFLKESGEAIFDPTYGAPEQFETTGSGYGFAGLTRNLLGVNFGAKITSTGAVPNEKFDAYSCGLTILRFGCTYLHDAKKMKQFRTELITKYDNDLQKWRSADGGKVSGALFSKKKCDFDLLDDANMWDIVLSLCEPDPKSRVTAKQAARKIKL